jgi:hypothetical protein
MQVNVGGTSRRQAREDCVDTDSGCSVRERLTGTGAAPFAMLSSPARFEATTSTAARLPPSSMRRGKSG